MKIVFQYISLTRWLVAIALVIIVGSQVNSLPHVISYQGRLTQPDGQPTADGDYTLEFSLYTDSVGGVALWNQSAVVTVRDGLFTHLLGSVSSLAGSIISDNDELFLAISVSGQPINPRTRLTAVAYAFAAGDLRVSDGAGINAIVTDGTSRELAILGPESQKRVTIGGGSFGNLRLNDSANITPTVELSASVDSGGKLFLNHPSGIGGIFLQAGDTGDVAVRLPESSINADELSNESGIAISVNSDQIPLVTGDMSDLLTIELTIPAEGYIHLQGKCYLLLSGTTGANSAIIQIDENEGGSSQFPYYTQGGLAGYANAGINYFPIYTSRVYFKGAGTYQFRMEGRAEEPAPASAKSWDHVLTAVYYPTSYYGSQKSMIDSTAISDETRLLRLQRIDPNEQ